MESDKFILGIYHAPSSKKSQHTIEQFTDEFLTFYAELIAKYKNLICLGDFNVHINDQSDVGAQSFSDSMYAMGLDQHVDVPTHKHGNTLDLIITESVSSFGICKTAYCDYISDHKMVYVILTVDKDQINSTTTKERSFDDFDLERFKIDVGNIKLPDETTDSKVKREFVISWIKWHLLKKK